MLILIRCDAMRCDAMAVCEGINICLIYNSNCLDKEYVLDDLIGLFLPSLLN